MSRIYDCFTFHNEFELLELRLKLLYNHIDYFVIVEGNTTFSSITKPYYLSNRSDLIKQYGSKIIRVLADMPSHENAWDNEVFQRNSIRSGLLDAEASDIIIISDVDEIVRPEIVADLRNSNADYFGFKIPYFNFKFNYFLLNDIESYVVGPMGCRFDLLKEPNTFRTKRFDLVSNNMVQVYEHAGWHFTYLGTNESIREKIKSFSHQELNNNEILSQINIEESMKKGYGFNPLSKKQFVAVMLNDYFPKELLNYPQYCVQDATVDIRELIKTGSSTAW